MKSYIDLEDMANVNCSNVLNIIQKRGTVSRNEITEISGLSWGGMTKIVNKLLEKEYITEKKQKKDSSSGRIPRILSINTDKNFVIGLDINKTGLKAIVADLTGRTLQSFLRESVAANRKDFLQEILSFVSDIFYSYDTGAIISIGIAMQGIVDNKTGISEKFPGIDDWQEVPIKSIFEEKFGIRVSVEHDPDCLLYPHITYQSKENILLLRIDQSIGMAVSIGGQILKGKGLFEIAHTTVIPNGTECHCGCRGCMEAYVRPCITEGKPNPEKFKELIQPLAITIQNMSTIFHSDKVILTGTLMEYQELFRDKLEDILRNMNCDIDIVYLELSDFAVQGAALIAVDKSINSLFIG